MNPEAEYLRNETANLDKTSQLLEELLAREALTIYELYALGTLLQNIYMGVENTLRCRMILRQIELPKSASWHKDMLLRAKELNLITENQYTSFRELLQFRHLHVYGYGHMLDEPRLRELAAPVSALCREYLREMVGAENL